MGYNLTGVIKSIVGKFFSGVAAAKLLLILNKTAKGSKLVKKLSAANGKLKGKIKKIKN
ncbi:MAG: hypothetical protein ABF289_08795 [Clostridiales bacterium]